MAIRCLLIVSLVIAAAGAPAAFALPVTYDITFVATRGFAPEAGSFTYDAATESFSNFSVKWGGALFDLTADASAPMIAGTVPCLDGLSGAAATFALLHGKCGTSSTGAHWEVVGAVPPDGPSETISLSHTSSTGSYVQIGATENLNQWIPRDNIGSFTISAQTGTFKNTGLMSIQRYGQTATLLPDGKVLVAGGQPNAPQFLTSAELYDPLTGKFSVTGSLSMTRYFARATLLSNGKVLITGGSASATAELYDPSTATFSVTGSMTTTRYGQTATLLPDGKVLVAGGATDSGVNLASAELYDPETGTFTATGVMTTVRAAPTATLLNNGMVLVAGGSKSASAELYNPMTGTFTITGSMITALSSSTATLLGDGKVLIAGGFGFTASEYLASAELYDPTTGIFSATGSMSNARGNFTATLLPDGKVLVAGGHSNGATGQVLLSAELYDSKTGAFKATGSMTVQRVLQIATLLNNGNVLIAGGGNSHALASAELFEHATAEPY